MKFSNKPANTSQQLEFLLTCPELLKADCFEFKPFSNTILFQELCQLKLELPCFPKQENKRWQLGRHAETLFLRAFAGVPNVKRVISSLLLMRGKQTIGEIDYLLDHALDGIIQLELSVKFYLLDPGLEGHSFNSFIGPRRTDRLKLRLDKLFQRQLRMSENLEKQALKLPESIPAYYHLVGYLFYPVSWSKSALCELNPCHKMGTWLKPSQLDYLEQQALYLPIKKECWLQTTFHESEKLLHPADLLGFSKANSFPFCFVKVRGEANSLVESERFFLVPEDWDS